MHRVYDRNFEYSIEGGDILNINENIIAVGISQRTPPQAIEILANNIFFNMPYSTISTILALVKL
ncbi:arginine deiminase family protein [Romboutsia sp.]|uniref:arginine deiminase family protein n=1 Tax=Romboutsia sp. TaxID=1965302 RepID=UPI003F31F085